MKKIAVILSGCGVFDGAEIHESVLALLSIEKNGASYQCFAPDILQHHVVNHITGAEMKEQRNVLVESARIARGNIKNINELQVNDFDALVVPGGFGVAKNLCDFAFKGEKHEVNSEVKSKCQEFKNAGKPAAYLCIAPAMVPKIYKNNPKITIGNCEETAQKIIEMQAVHQNCNSDDYVFDAENKILTTPAYMLANNIFEAAQGIEKTITKLITIA